MTIITVLKAAIEVLVVLSVCFAILQEDKFIAFEKRLVKLIKKKIKRSKHTMRCIIKMPGHRRAEIRAGVHNDYKAISRELDSDNLGVLELAKDVVMFYDADGFAKQLPGNITDDYCEIIYFGDVLFVDRFFRNLNASQEKYIENYVAANGF